MAMVRLVFLLGIFLVGTVFSIRSSQSGGQRGSFWPTS
jgi:hypothetical protein